ncbi:glycosyltransferase family 2 protein [Acidisoma cellulosilytica]|uniref:Glycosyltransferase family 2 protein n=1 Tax=Acidisoma cellulosilyticum TaxID=2802395 RepID=A0A963Z6V4_9PROT|nr:glycosyltransferase family A protein [Acidisoma cellulosilyticum]MCB8883656.1 glycosyltransferase family 2 protein [Acidisoma cellulosilyticum]
MNFPRSKNPKTVVAIPAKDEADLIGACLCALAHQSELADDIVLLVNNATDRTAEIARSFGSTGGRLHVKEVTLSPAQANAGTARRLAMEYAADIAGSQGAILTTDADGRVPEDWVARNLGWLRSGYDAVCGMAAIDPADEALIPAHLIDDDLNETKYKALLDEIDHWIDPRIWDSWPRHTHRSGASIAVRSAVYAAVGGVPHVSQSEDREFIAKLEGRDCKIRHDNGIIVTVSGRRLGRAPGGMAETIARRIIQQDKWADDRLEAPQAALRRAQLRRAARDVWTLPSDCRSLASALRLPVSQIQAFMLSPWFGAAWAEIEAASPVLRRKPIAMASLPHAIREAAPILHLLRHSDRPIISNLEITHDDMTVLAE